MKNKYSLNNYDNKNLIRFYNWLLEINPNKNLEQRYKKILEKTKTEILKRNL